MRKLWTASIVAAVGIAPAVSAAPRTRVPARKASKAVTPATRRVTRLTILPNEIHLDGPLASQQLLIMGTLGDGTQLDLTDKVKLTSTAAKIVALEKGEVLVRGNGKTAIEATYPGVSAKVPVTVTGATRPVSYSFRNDVVPVLSRLGCSSGTCHGANSGKGGFRLSLRGYAPELDYLWITRQFGGRRISREDPENSLFLRKPLMQVPHAGGLRLQKGSREYYTLLGWLRQGAPGVDEKDPKLVGLSPIPGERTYRRGESQHVLIQAQFSDGSVRDVTNRAIFGTNDSGVAAVSEEGEITTGTSGATAIQAKYMDQLAVVRVTVP